MTNTPAARTEARVGVLRSQAKEAFGRREYRRVIELLDQPKEMDPEGMRGSQR